jgi:hypothetical protein
VNVTLITSQAGVDGTAVATWVLAAITLIYASLTLWLAASARRSARAAEHSLLLERIPIAVPSGANPANESVKVFNVGKSFAYTLKVLVRINDGPWMPAVTDDRRLAPGVERPTTMPWPAGADYAIKSHKTVRVRVEYQAFTGEWFATERVYRNGEAHLQTYKHRGGDKWLRLSLVPLRDPDGD